MKKLKTLISNNLEGKKVLAWFIIANVPFAFMLLITIPYVMQYSNGMDLFDISPSGYSEEYVGLLLNALGEQGRAAYLYYQLPIDMVYPLLFGISNCLLLAYFLNKINRLNGFWFYLCLLPVFGALYDYFENFSIITLLVNYPDYTIFSAKAANLFTLLKSSTITIYYVVLLIAMAIFGYKKFIKKV